MSSRLRSPWMERGLLGSGSFGLVRLFSNEETGSKIALKEMKNDILSTLPPDECDKMITRLKNEIKIMWEHDHINLIKALMAPPDMYYIPPANVLHVWMEYCDGGDLRSSVLCLPMNCCGIEEKQLRRICNDINNGIKFLHSYPIIHRDLKPENILIKHIDQNNVVYKLTDFGYAKLYSLSTSAKSMVGTPQYVAPEIINDNEHGITVDFWSFGIIAFELATGIRPFLHRNSRPFKWIGPTCSKPDNVIYIEYGDKSDQLNQTESLPPPYHLSSVFAGKLTKWLQVALHIKPEQRGGVDRSSSEVAPCILQMENVLDTKVLNVVCMSKGYFMSFEIKEDTKVSSLFSWLQEQGYTPENQYVLTEQRYLLTSQEHNEKNLLSCLQMDTNICMAYLFSKDQEPSFKLVEQVLPTVQKLVAVGDEKLHKDDRHLHFTHAYSHIREQAKLFNRLYKGHDILLSIIDIKCNDLKQRGSLLCKCHQILGAARLVKRMHIADIEQLKAFNEASELFEQWDRYTAELKELIKELEKLSCSLHDLQQEIDSILTKSEVMMQFHLSGMNRLQNFNSDCVEKALSIVRDEKSHVEHGSMAVLLSEATQMAENIIQDHLNKINFLQIYLNVCDLCQRVESVDRELTQLEERYSNINDATQRDKWSLVTSSRGNRNGNIDVMQSLPNSSVFTPNIHRSNSVTSCNKILVRLKSQTSISSESTDGDNSDDIHSLIGSLKNEILNMSEMNDREIKKNELILMSATKGTDVNFYIEEDNSTSN